MEFGCGSGFADSDGARLGVIGVIILGYYMKREIGEPIVSVIYRKADIIALSRGILHGVEVAGEIEEHTDGYGNGFGRRVLIGDKEVRARPYRLARADIHGALVGVKGYRGYLLVGDGCFAAGGGNRLFVEINR